MLIFFRYEFSSRARNIFKRSKDLCTSTRIVVVNPPIVMRKASHALHYLKQYVGVRRGNANMIIKKYVVHIYSHGPHEYRQVNYLRLRWNIFIIVPDSINDDRPTGFRIVYLYIWCGTEKRSAQKLLDGAWLAAWGPPRRINLQNRFSLSRVPKATA